MSPPLYDVLLVAHVVAAVVGFGALAISGLAAAAGRRSRDPAADASVRRFFRPGPDLPARVIYLVPALGLAMLFGGDRVEVSHIWPWVGLTLWTAAAATANLTCWPSERAAQQAIAAEPPDLDGFARACARIERGVAATSLLFVAAVAVMILQP